MVTFDLRKKRYLIALLTIPLLQGCVRPLKFNAFDDGRNSFYTRNYYWENPRFPLIEPFELWKTPIGGWSINIGEIQSEHIVSTEKYGPVDLVFCSNNIIYCHVLENAPGHNPQMPQLSYPERWFTINMDNMTMTNYDGKDAFRAGIGDSIYSLLQSPDSLYVHFCHDVWALPWIPDTVVVKEK
jgi:hypothetical protein